MSALGAESFLWWSWSLEIPPLYFEPFLEMEVWWIGEEGGRNGER